ncbi:hypothetical protein D3C78_986030 [compost metagenome]
MVSPARLIATWSPGRMSRDRQRGNEPRLTWVMRRSSSITGFNSSTGVTLPVRPIRKRTSRTSASAWAKGYFQAAIQ